MANQVLTEAPARFALAGHSMGGRVALEVYRRAPERVERLALLDTGYEGVATGEPERRAVLVQQAVRSGIDSIAAAWGPPMLAPAHRSDPRLVQAVFDMVNRMSPAIYAGQVNALLNRPDACDVLAAVFCPTLILCSQEDGWSPPERHVHMASLVRHHILRLIEHCDTCRRSSSRRRFSRRCANGSPLRRPPDHVIHATKITAPDRAIAGRRYLAHSTIDLPSPIQVSALRNVATHS